MTSSIKDNCQELVSLLQNDVQEMCSGMLQDNERNTERCAEYFERLRDHEELLANILSSLTLRMRSCHNALNTVVHIPEAVLHRIMVEAVSDTAPRNRLFIGQICSHWRKRALDIRSLWSGIDLHWKELSEEYLARSQPLPIDIRFESSTYYDVEELNFHEHFKILTPHLSRLRTLAVTIPKPLLSASLKFLSSFDAPHLESLVVKGDDDDGMIEITDEGVLVVDTNDLFNDITPKLTELYLKNVTIGWDAVIFKRLKVLKLERCAVSAQQSNLLQILRNCPDLEALHVGKMRSLTFLIDDGLPAEDDLLEVNKLRLLSLHHLQADELRKLLWRLSIPDSTQMTITCCLDDIHAFHDIFPPSPHHLANITGMKSLSIAIGHRTTIRGTLYSHGGPNLLQVELTCVDPAQDAEQQIESIKQSLPFQNLERLTVSAKQCTREIPLNLSHNILLTTPTLKYFSVYGVHGYDVMKCLDVESAESMFTFDCNDVRFSEADVSAWLSKTREVRLPVTLLEFNRCVGITDEHIDILRAMIPEVSWDEEGQDFSWPHSVVLDCQSQRWS